MAGEWIPVRVDLADDPAVILIAAECGIDEFSTVGRLIKLWSWANRQLSNGDARGVTESWIDRHVLCAGFAHAMVKAGWLTFSDGVLIIPNFDRWNAKSSKRRLLTSQRMKVLRSRDAKSDADSDAGSVTKSAPEESRVEKKENTKGKIHSADAGRKRKTPKTAVPAPESDQDASTDTRKPENPATEAVGDAIVVQTPPQGPIFVAVAEVTGCTGSHVGKVAAELAAMTPPITPEEIREFGRRFLELCPHVLIDGTPRLPNVGELGKYVTRVRAAQPAAIPRKLTTKDEGRERVAAIMRATTERPSIARVPMALAGGTS